MSVESTVFIQHGFVVIRGECEMAQTPEGKFKEEFRNEFQRIEHARIFISADAIKIGIPDILGVYRGKAWVVELKCEAEVTKAQIIELVRWKMAGAIAGVLRRHVGDLEVLWFVPSGVSLLFEGRFDNLEHFKLWLLKQCICAN